MSNYDVAFGLDSTSLDSGMSGVYADPAAKAKFFEGSMKETVGTVAWEVKAAPTFVLSASGQNWAHYADSLTASGGHPTGPAPTTNAFKLVFPQFYGSLTTANDKKDGTALVNVYGEVAIASDKLTITPLSIWLDETKMPFFPKFVINLVLTKVLEKATTMLKGISIPALSFEGVDLSAPVVSIADGRLVLASCLKSKGTASIAGVSWPTNDLFTLISQDVLNILLPNIAQQLKGKQIAKSGSKGKGKFDYSVTLGGLSGIKSQAGANPPSVSADVTLDWSLSCSACAMSSAAP